MRSLPVLLVLAAVNRSIQDSEVFGCRNAQSSYPAEFVQCQDGEKTFTVRVKSLY
jgi:hypothetical protein